MVKTKHRVVSVLVVLCLVVVMLAGLMLAMPLRTGAAFSDSLAGVPIVIGVAQTPSGGGSAGGPLMKETSQIGFGGHNWYVIGFDGAGVASEAGTITLIEQGRYSTATDFFATSANNSYGSSKLLANVNALLLPPPAEIAFTAEESDWMIPRTLDGVAGAPVTGQKLWPLSGQEAINVSYDVRVGAAYMSNGWWLRSPAASGGTSFAQHVTHDGIVTLDQTNPGNAVNVVYRSTRVAFQLDIAALLFVSLADDSDKTALAPNAELPAFTPPTGVGVNTLQMMKLTMITPKLDLAVTSTPVNGDTIDFSYVATSTFGSYDSLSALVRAADGSIKYYGKLDEASYPNASVKIPSGLAAGDTLEVFIEKFSGANTTDLASAPVILYTQPGPSTPPATTPPTTTPTPTPEQTPEPLPASGHDTPQPGDSSNIPLWVLCGAAALTGLVLLVRRMATQR